VCDSNRLASAYYYVLGNCMQCSWCDYK